MKALKLKVLDVLDNTKVPEGFKFNYRTELLNMIDAPMESITIKQMAIGVKISDALQHTTDTGVLILEDAEYDYLKDAVTRMVWRLSSKAIIQFVDEVNSAVEPSAQEMLSKKHSLTVVNTSTPSNQGTIAKEANS